MKRREFLVIGAATISCLMSAKAQLLNQKGEYRMLKVRYAEERGPSDLGWLNSKHSFSFAHYYDPNHMGFEALRVINEDRVVAGAGFGTHPHKDMEIISYVLDGALEHKDSIGNGSVIRPNDVQRMSAGTGVFHSEYNHSPTDPVHFLQIWFLPDHQKAEPSYQQKHFPRSEKLGSFRLVASKTGREGSVSLNQDVDMRAAIVTKETGAVSYDLPTGRKAWIHIATGTANLGDLELRAGDGVAVEDAQRLTFTSQDEAEIILFDLRPLAI